MTIDKKFIESFAKVTERAAYGASLYKGKNDKIAADQAAVDEMRTQLNLINMTGRIVIGEGELDEAPMLYVNEIVGTKTGQEFDIAVDPLEGTNFTAKNLPNALSVMAVAKKNNLLKAPDIYMEKIAVGPNLPKKLIDLDFGVKKNIEKLAEAKNTTPEKLTVCLLKRPRHNSIVEILENMKVNIDYITDGDVSGVISVAKNNSKIDMYIGTGGAPEGVLAAAALDCLSCQMQTRLVFEDHDQADKAKKLGINNLKKKYNIEDMINDDVIFCATGVTSGHLVKGIKDLGESFESETLILHKSTKTNKIIKKVSKK